MCFDELCSTLEANDLHTENIFERCEELLNASFDEYKYNLDCASLKIIEESGTDEDQLILFEAAKDGLIGKTRNIITKMVESLKEFIRKIIDAIESFFNKDKTKETLKKVEEASKKNPKIKSMKINVPDFLSKEKLLDTYISKNKKYIAKAKNGKLSDADMEAARKDFDRIQNMVRIGTVALSIPVSLALLKKFTTKSYYTDIDEAFPDGNIPDEGWSEKTLYSFKEILANQNQAIRIKASGAKNFATSIFDAIRGVFTKSKPLDYDLSTLTRESAENLTSDQISFMLDNIIDEIDIKSESTDYLLDEYDEEVNITMSPEEYLESMEEELFGESDDDSMTADEYLESMEEELFGESEEDDSMTAEEYLESMEEELFGESEEDDSMTAEEYLESMEEELFGDM